MGYIKHNAIICTTWKKEDATEAQAMAKKLLSENESNGAGLVSELVEYAANVGYSFFIAPDGSKEGWEPSCNFDESRNKFLNWLDESDNYCEYVEVCFGGDDEHDTIERSSIGN